MGHQHSKLPFEQQSIEDLTVLSNSQCRYICQNTNLVDQEVYRRHKEFLAITKNGRMTKEEFTGVLQEIWPTGNVQKLSNYLFYLSDRNQQGFITFPEYLRVDCQLRDDKSYLGFLFDMFDINQKGFLSREMIEPLFASMFELIGHPTDEQSGSKISQQHITHLIETVDKSKSKRLMRYEFINIRNHDWIDEENGIGAVLAEHSC